MTLPAAARHWLASVLDAGERVVAVRPMAGATSSEMHAVTTEDAHGVRRRLVLRRYVNRAWLAREPDLAEHEARVLSLLASTDVRAPQLVAVDATGASCDVPAVLMTRLAGRPRRRPD